MNVCSGGLEKLYHALGEQGGVHFDGADEAGSYTVFALACQWSKGVGGVL